LIHGKSRYVNKVFKGLAAITLLGIVPLLGQCSHNPDEGANGPWRHRLYSPTYFTKLGDTFALVDTWHHRILFSNSLPQDLDQWSILTEDIGGPHSIATDGDIVVYDDTGHGNLRAGKKLLMQSGAVGSDPNVEEHDLVFDVGLRPHRVIYDEAMKSFYAISSGSQEILRVTNENNLLVVQHLQTLPFLNKAYTRSMSIIDGHMYFVTRSQGIIESTYKDDVFDYVKSYPVPDILYDLNDVFRSEAGWYYVTGTPNAIVRCRDLDDLATGNYEDLIPVLGIKGTPYYLSEIDGRLYLPQVGQDNGLISFVDTETGPVTDIMVHFQFGPPEPADKWRKDQYPR
jgi:hypothetical protein